MKLEYDDIDALLQAIFAGEITEYSLPEDLYNAIAKVLKAGLYKGYGKVFSDELAHNDFELLQELRENIYMFSGAKTFQQVREMVDKLTTEEGKIRSFQDFKEDAKSIFDTFNEDYLKTEYNTAIGQGMAAEKWQQIEKEKETLPFLQYSTIGDACDICAPLDGFTARVDDDAWSEIMPLNHFNCMCIVEQLDEEEGSEKEWDESDRDAVLEKVGEHMDDVFKMNAGKDGYIFSPDHPYFTVPKADRDFAKDNFDLPIPEED